MIIERFAGHFKHLVILLIAVSIIFSIQGIGQVIDLGELFKDKVFISLLNVSAIVLVFFALIKVKKMIYHIDTKSEKESKVQKKTEVPVKKEKIKVESKRSKIGRYLDLTKNRLAFPD